MNHNRTISVIGLGYVGLPVAAAFAKSGASVIAFDVNQKRVDELRRGEDRTREVTTDDLGSPNLEVTTKPDDLAKADFHIVCVPTPIDSARRPDLSALSRASETVGPALKPGDIVVYESTVYPGATEDLCIPILEKFSGLRSATDFAVGYSPERINPGDTTHTFEQIKKVVSAQTPEALKIVAEVYGSVVTAGIYEAPNIKTAEAAKVIENTQRDLNIALMNELSAIFAKMEIDTADVLAAAGTKWNFLPFKPGLVGGHCIGIDPYYLTHRAEELGYHPEVILAGRRINDSVGQRVANQCLRMLAHSSTRPVRETVVTILGLSFKENVPDVRNSRVVDIISELRMHGVTVQVCDPVADVSTTDADGVELLAPENLIPADAVILAVPHREFLEGGWTNVRSRLRNGEGVVLDVKSQLSREELPSGVSLWRL
ncbi:MAG: nucleotide sugar dehydrogenase [Rhizobiaceae bacterium]